MAQCRQEANVMKTKWATLRDLPATEVSHQAAAELWDKAGRQAGGRAGRQPVGHHMP
jgi:hypothetical protein